MFAMPKILLRGWKNKLQTSRKYLQMTRLTKDLYPAYNSKFYSKKTNNPIRKSRYKT